MTHGTAGTGPRTGHRRARVPLRRALVAGLAAGLVAVPAGCAWPGEASPAGAASSAGSPSATSSPAPTASTRATPGTSTPPSTPTPTPTPTPEPEATPEVPAADAPTPEATPPVTPPPAETPEPTEPPAPQYVTHGSTGPEVLALQQRLQELGYGLVDPDGVYGSSTRQAVWAFQKAAGLGRDGVIGPQTQAALDAGYRPTPRSTSGHVVEIDLERQILLAVDGGHVTKVINASSGNGKPFEAKGGQFVAHTPRGSFQVYSQDNGMHSSTLELGDMWRPKYFSGGIAVHGSGSIPPYPASHGCVRVSNGAMNWLWDSWGMPIGTPVLVY
ncbi:murein L,D-transpeptidase [Xylanimonas allomyrinae]|uniref:Murein L,D-transpeptidase n=1 Tax=Xylanimonas allomyrinae TaxID=2509459 RepID=A0A4V0YEJ3_9MICO|nr:L,D-transpeptidase family protein [Xylanimonas allomyrinae]QAY64411.1 murein L,D-transpeptidase [Xylanimonas allomyrinae]